MWRVNNGVAEVRQLVAKLGQNDSDTGARKKKTAKIDKSVPAPF